MQRGTIPSPYPYFGGKRRIAPAIWERFGQVKNYVEPFFGGGAVLLGRPGGASGTETINDINGFLCNFWRAIQAVPEAVARAADWPVNELDHMARNEYLKSVRPELWSRIAAEPEFYDTKLAGWWVWGMSASIGLTYGLGKNYSENALHLSSPGTGIHRSSLHLGDPGKGILGYFAAIAERVRRVRVMSGDWSRALSDSVLRVSSPCAVLLDPPYDENSEVYKLDQKKSVAADVWEWACANGDRHGLRIAVCGYQDGRDVPPGWETLNWRGQHGYQSDNNQQRLTETVWFSPGCLGPDQGSLI